MTHFEPKTARERAHFSHDQHVKAPPEDIFPLLCPVREYDWIKSWQCELVYTESGLAEDGGIFQTSRGDDGGIDTWVISRYEPSQRISFVRVNSLRAMQYDIRLASDPDGSTRLTWEQTITALNDDGDDHVSNLREEDFVALIETIERLLEHYLATGQALAVAH